MMQQYLSIGKMAELNRVSIPTLRLYDRTGLLKPAYVDPETGYRYYTLQQNARLDMIAYMKELGMSLAEIGDVLRREDLALIESILAEKNEQLHEQMRKLQERHDAVERAIASIERYRKSPATGTISLEYIDKRWIWSIPCPVNFYELGPEGYEQALLALRRALTQAGVPQIHSYNPATSIRQADFEAGRFAADRVFIFGDKRLQDYPGDVAWMDSGMYACIYLGSYVEEMDGGRQLLRFCRARGYEIAGDYLCEELTEFHVFGGASRGMYLRLQVPVRFSQRA